MGFKKLVLCALCLLIAQGCVKKQKQQIALSVVRVNGVSLDATTFSKQLARKLKRFDSLAAKDPRVIDKAKDEIIKNFVVSVLLRQLASEKNIVVSSDEVLAEFDRVRRTYPDDLSFKESLVNEGLSVDEWKESLKDVLIQKKAFTALDGKESKEALNRDARAYFETHKNEFRKKPRVKLQQLVVAKEDDAQRLLKKIKEGSSFDDLAKKYSVSPDSAEGGRIGYVDKGSVPAFDAAFNMRVGQTSSVIKSSYGFHIIRVLDKKDGSQESYEQAQTRIQTQLSGARQQKVFSQWLQNALRSAKVEKDEALISKLRVYTEGS
jgi:peptidyl-prolyl cis-trans isomerase C